MFRTSTQLLAVALLVGSTHALRAQTPPDPTFHKYSVTLVAAGASAHTSELMARHHFDDRVRGSCFFLCFPDVEYPLTTPGSGTVLLTARRHWPNGTAIGILLQPGTDLGSTLGYRGPGYFTTITPHTGMVALQVSRSLGAWRLGAGPALFPVKVEQRGGSTGPARTSRQTRLGGVVELGWSWPRNSAVYMDAAAQVRVLPGLELEPYPLWSNGSGATTTFPGGRFDLHHGAFTFGLGLRL